jgi:hypothetical protein
MLHATLTATVLLLLAGVVHAQDAPSWIGQKVIIKYKNPLRAGNRVVDEDALFRVYTVERSEGDWLWLVAGNVHGRARSTDVVPFDRAIDFCTQEIRANPSSPVGYSRLYEGHKPYRED